MDSLNSTGIPIDQVLRQIRGQLQQSLDTPSIFSEFFAGIPPDRLPHSVSAWTQFPSYSSKVVLAKSGFLGQYWKPLTASIIGSTIKFYKDPSDFQPYTSFNFDLISCEILVSRGLIYCIQPISSIRSIKFKACSRKSAAQWTLALFIYKLKSEQLQQYKNSIIFMKDFLKKSFISLENMKNIVQTGDLILFQKKMSFKTLFKRISSPSKYHHIGMLVKGNQLLIVQSILPGGVQMGSLMSVCISMGMLGYKRMYIRKLMAQRDRKFVSIVQSKTKEWLGRPCTVKIKDMSSTSRKRDVGFSNGQLVAEFYKALGFIDENMNTSIFSPMTFGQDIQLVNAQLGEISTVIFDEIIQIKKDKN